MFTGIIEEVGRVSSRSRTAGGARLRVAARLAGTGLSLGESIAVDGACLTVARRGRGWFEADCTHETLRLTTLGALRAGSAVNLERALRPTDRMGGHFVQGHVDGVGTVLANARRGEDWILRVVAPEAVAPYLVRKGSVAVNGVSLTLSGLDGAEFEVTLIPHTLEVTNLRRLRRGGRVNLEADILGKYVRAFLVGDSPVLG